MNKNKFFSLVFRQLARRTSGAARGADWSAGFKHIFSRLVLLALLLLGAAGFTPANAQTFTNKTTDDGLGSNIVWGVFASGSTVYAATQGGVSKSINSGASFTNSTTGLGSVSVRGVFDSGSTVYAATLDGVSKSINSGGSFTNSTTGLGDTIVRGVFEPVLVSGSKVYAATDGGLSISDDGGATFTNKTTADGLGSNRVKGVFASVSTVYAATEGGLSISDDGGATFTNKTTADGLGSNRVKGVFASVSTVYAATESDPFDPLKVGGLSISNDGGATFTNKTTANGLGSNDVYGVFASGSTVYAATAGGLSISTDGGATFNNKTTANNGLGNNYVNGVFASDSKVYAATFGGLSFASLATATTNAASSVGQTGATLNGTIDDNGASTTVTFDYGTTNAYGTNIAATTGGTVSAGAGSTPVAVTLTGLTCNTTYHFRVKGVNSVSTTNGGDATFTTTACAPGAPTIGSATPADASATVAFSAPASDGGAAITGYTATASPGGITAVGNGGTALPITVTGLTNGVAYTFTVTASNSAGPGAASAASNSVTPKASQTITFSNPGAQSLGTTPTLTASSSAGGGYPVSFTSATTGVCTITTGGALTFVTTGSCTINANQAGNASTLAAPQVSQTFTVNAVAPGVPTAVVASAGNSQATVSWTAPAGNGGAAIIGYRVQIATTSGGTYSDAAGTCAFATTGTSTAVTCIATGLTNGTQYFFKVAAVSSAGTGSYSTASSGVTPVVPVINGACGTSANLTTAFLPTANLCSAGTAEPVTAGTSSWAWRCLGSGPGATNATCTAPYPVVNGGGGTVGAIQTPGTNGWQIDQALSGFVALPAPAPAGVTFPGGATKVVLNTGTRGTSTTVTLRFSSIPAGAQLYKYGKENGIGDTNKWFAYPATIDAAAGTVTYTLTDGQKGDNDWTENSVIDDPVALGTGGGAVASIPTLSEWGLIILSTLMALFGLMWMRRRQGFTA
ncbi:MAG: IPTL-CTERM sorting domain-containing protein [Rhodoferax sp.]|nr:IPTL-CTERM sorting domain-containing protein [Rhodoferax sp.]